MNWIEQLLSARSASVPLIAIRTPDPALTIRAIVDKGATRDDEKEATIFLWDCVQGIVGKTPSAKKIAEKWKDEDTANATQALELAATRLPEYSVILLMFPATGFKNANWIQAFWNLRDRYKSLGSCAVLLGPDFQLPAELVNDVLVIDEPLPTPEQLKERVLRTLRDASASGPVQPTADAPDPEMVSKAVDAVAGLADFPAEQCLAMSTYYDRTAKTVKLKLSDLWERKRQMIEATPGLSVWRGGETFADIAGYENAKTFFKRILAGKRRPNAIVFWDEIEKALGSGGIDTSGVSQAYLGTILSWMQDNKARGVINVGPPGSGKSLLAKAVGAEAGIPTIALDMAGMKNSLVGESEARLRMALKTIAAVSQGRAFFIATSNKISGLPPELKRRFKSGTFFFDLPTKAERQAIWNLYETKFTDIAGMPRPADDGWTGAEIAQCCELASEDLGCTLMEASAYIVPVSVAAKEQIDTLRSEAHGKYISASHPGTYSNAIQDAAEDFGRAFNNIREED